MSYKIKLLEAKIETNKILYKEKYISRHAYQRIDKKYKKEIAILKNKEKGDSINV